MDSRNPLIGWYDSPDQARDQPSYNPPLICVVCFKALTADTVRTIGVMVDGEKKSFFYRLHRACHEELTEDEQLAYDESALALGRTEMPHDGDERSPE